MNDGALERVDAGALGARPLPYHDFFMAAFVTILLLSNLIGAPKLSSVGGFTLGAGILFFPLSYVVGNLLVEVHGYARARRCVWAGFAAMIVMALMKWVVVALPPADGWPDQKAHEAVFGSIWRIAFASLCAFRAGDCAKLLVIRSFQNPQFAMLFKAFRGLPV